MKKISLFLLVLILVFTAVSCKKEETDVPDGMFLVENDIAYFDLYLPEGWVVDRNDGMISAHASATDAKSNVSVTSMAFSPEYSTFMEYIEKGFIEHYKNNFPDMEIIQDFTETTIGEKEALEIVFKATVGEMEYQFKQIMAIGEKSDLFVFTYTSTPDIFDSHAKEIESIVKEIKFN